MKAIGCSDLHLLSKNPSCRKDNLVVTQIDKFEEILRQSHNKGIPILQAGDFFDRPRDWDLLPEIITLIRKYHFARIYCVYGQHDIYLYNKNTNPKTNLGILIKAGLVTELTDKPITFDDADVYGASWGQPVPKIKRKSQHNVLVIHKSIGTASLFKGHDYDDAKRFLKKHKFDTILAGDIHRSFEVEYKGRKLVNAGCLLRKTAEKYNFKHHPGFYIIDTKKGIHLRHEIKFEPAKDVIDLTKTEVDPTESLDMFVRKINASALSGPRIDFVNMVTKHMKKKKVRPAVREILTEELAKGQ